MSLTFNSPALRPHSRLRKPNIYRNWDEDRSTTWNYTEEMSPSWKWQVYNDWNFSFRIISCWYYPTSVACDNSLRPEDFILSQTITKFVIFITLWLHTGCGTNWVNMYGNPSHKVHSYSHYVLCHLKCLESSSPLEKDKDKMHNRGISPPLTLIQQVTSKYR